MKKRNKLKEKSFAKFNKI